ncbi:hypothetical protein SAY87_004035 [Trapa incisa]|uniref:Gnk2-homologous domain-containing protein n=1 Tax=Trapa incisa TaxID=236973 RepID=A0AAN7JPE0_9MYRT|nr:hypothetical protein SAY87_004035 [Trapa incisa]
MAILNASEGFGAAKVRGVYALGQCWNTLSIEECRICLEKAGDEVRRCLPSKEGRSLNAGCYLRYSTENFYNGTEEAKEPNSTGLPVNGIIAAVSLAAFAFILLSAISAFAIFKRIAKSRKENFQLHQISIGIGKSGLNFKYETLEKATRNFSISRKLGQGGTGSVWKLYKHNSLWEALDPSLEGNLAKEEAARVLKIGLMCTQASAADRPSMHQVLEMLMNGDSETPEPNQPPFLMARAMNQCTDSLVLNAAKLDISCTSSEYSPTGLYCLNGQRAGEDLARY